MDAIHTEKRHGLTVNIHQDPDPQSPADWGDDNLFLVGYHRDFSVEGPRVYRKLPEGAKRDPKDRGRLLVDKADVQALLQGQERVLAEDELAWPEHLDAKYHVFALEAYIHGDVRLSLVQDGANFPDRRWDVSVLGAVFVAREETQERDKAVKLAQGLVETWNDALSGNVYGFEVRDQEGQHLESCWGFYGDYDGENGALAEARSIVDHLTNKGATDHNGQRLMFNE